MDQPSKFIHKSLTAGLLVAILMASLVVVFGSSIQAVAQEAAKDANELSKELVNPIGPNWLINTYVNVIEKDGEVTDESRTSVEWLIQPVMPVPLNRKTGLTLMNRPTLPIFFKDPVPQTNAMGDFSDFDSFSGIGDLSIQSSLGKMQSTSFGKVMWGIGANLVFPTASMDELGSEKYSAGPVGMLVGFTSDYTFGAVVSHVWSYAGDDSREDVNQTQFQLLYYKQLGNGWQIGDNPTWTFKSNASSGEKYDIPIGLGIFKTVHIAGTGWRFGITPRYFLKSYDSWGNDWGVSFTITPVIKNPFN